MTDHTDDDKFDAWVPGAARDYNRPPAAAPREAMWAAIERTLDAAPQGAAPQRAAPHGSASQGAVSNGGDRERAAAAPLASSVVSAAEGPSLHRRRRMAPVWWQAAAAAMLVAAGIGIGRVWSGREASSAITTASTGGEERVAGGDRSTSPSGAAAPGTERGASEPGRGAALTPDGAGGSAATRADGGRGRSYDVATMQHLSRAEALLTAFRADDGAGGTTSMERWARDLLADTRLFIDSPAASDARSRQLLLDLELILAQIVQLPAESSADRGLVQRSIERGAVLSRLRSTIPAGYASGT